MDTLRRRQRRRIGASRKAPRLWSWSRTQADQHVKASMRAAGIEDARYPEKPAPPVRRQGRRHDLPGGRCVQERTEQGVET